MKKGEGSRGGHIIGHTKGGSAIYGSPADHVQAESKRTRIAKGLAIVGGSLIGAALIGRGAGKVARVAAHFENEAFKAAKVVGAAPATKALVKASKFSINPKLAAGVLQEVHTDLRFAAATAGAAGATYGGNQILDATNKKTTKNQALVASAALGGSLFAVRLAEYAVLSPTLGHAAKVAAQKIRKPIKGRG